ncbi:MAG: DUF3015 family protein [Thermodesulfobacteriota bacterium]
MKRSMVVLAACLIAITLCSPVQAGQKNYGCGLGTMVFGNDESLVSQVAAAMINWFLFNQPLAISSGTSNCEKPESLTKNEKVKVFVADNMDNLASDIARGQGEYVETLAVLMDVPENGRPEFRSKLKNHFPEIYPDASVTADQVTANIQALL